MYEKKESVIKLFQEASRKRDFFTAPEIALRVEKSIGSIWKELRSLLKHHYIEKIAIEIDGKVLVLYKEVKE